MFIKVKASILAGVLNEINPILNYSNTSLKGRCVLLKASDGKVGFGVDSPVGIFEVIAPKDSVEIIKEGSVFLEGKNLLSILLSFEDSVVDISVDDAFCNISCGDSFYQLSFIISETPVLNMTPIPESEESFSYNLPLLQEKLLALKQFIATYDRPNLNGVYVGNDFMIACNGYQGAKIKAEAQFSKLKNMVINEPLINLILNIKDNKEIFLFNSDRFVLGFSGNLYFNVIKNEGEYPVGGVEQIFGVFERAKNVFSVDALGLSKSLRRLLLLSSSFKREEIQTIEINTDKENMILQNTTTNSAGKEKIKLSEVNVGSLNIKIDGMSLKESIKYFKGNVSWHILDTNSPIFLTDNYLTQFFAGLRT